jgi:uncharacterized LabA/DUF88 family protein
MIAFNLEPFMNVEKIALFIDGPNFYYGARALNLDVDFKRLLAEFERRGSLLRAYYTPLWPKTRNLPR